VLEDGNAILACGEYSAVKGRSPAGTIEIDHGCSALMPALVNAHTHLELSALGGTIPLPQPGFSQWLRELLPRRAALDRERQTRAAAEAERALHDAGTGLYGDHANDLTDAAKGGRPGLDRQVFAEILGFNRVEFEVPAGNAVSDGGAAAGMNSRMSLAAHACYSTSAELIRKAKAWTVERRLPFSIHAAEHPEEMEFIEKGTGFCRDLLESLGKWTPDWRPPGTTPIRYLEGLGVLDERTLLVHAVHLRESDWEIISRKRCTVCFCPRSNHFLGVGRPDIGKALRLGISAALGTDSLAGNTDLNLFSEAVFVLDHHPDVSPRDLLFTITQGGASALHKQNASGSLDPMKRPLMLEVTLPGSTTESQLSETIIRMGSKGAVRWANHPKHV
jgi:aminodeoxyfutalosine deaminase